MAKKKISSPLLLEIAQKHIPGGVNSPVRAFKAVGGAPIFMDKGKGARIFDVDGNAYIDYVCSWGPLIHGHAYPATVRAIRVAAAHGTSFGTPTMAETALASLIRDAFPSIEKIRLVNSGTEACMSAIRLARAFTKRDGVVKFEGCYHGHSDGLLVKAGSGAATLGIPTSPGVPKDYTAHTYVLPYNNLESFKKLCQKKWREIACVIVEPIVGNMGVVLPRPGFLEGLRTITQKYGILLIFDEVITGFRICFGGAQNLLHIKPDLTTLGKIIGGGLPIGAYGGRGDIMKLIAPEGPVYQAGTLSGNPVAVAAGLATLKGLMNGAPYRRLAQMGSLLEEGVSEASKSSKASLRINRYGSMFTLFFNHRPITDFATASTCNTRQYAKFFWGLIAEGVYFPPSQFEAAFLSTVHTEKDVHRTIQACYRALRRL